MLQVDTAVAEKTRSAVQAEEMKAKVKAQTAQAIADDAQKDLAEALPALDAALASLRNLNKSDVTEVTGLRGKVAELGLVLDSLSLCSNSPSIGLQHPQPFPARLSIPLGSQSRQLPMQLLHFTPLEAKSCEGQRQELAPGCSYMLFPTCARDDVEEGSPRGTCPWG